MRLIFALLILVAVLHSGLSWRSFQRGRYKNFLGAPITEKAPPKAQWFHQQLDHFNPSDGRTWLQRYFTNAKFYKQGGPVFLMIGGEGPANGKWVVEGEMVEYAEEHGALCFLLEHRYYGDSHPLPDMSVKNLAYLSAEQALADLAYFIEEMKKTLKLPANTKWITFGGSYPGSLSAWMRLKYPHLVHGAMSASGPLLAKIDFQEYFVVVAESLKTHSEACVNTIAEAIRQVHIMLRHRIGQQGLEKLFNFCDPIDQGKTTRNDIANLYETIADNFAEVVQYNKDNRNESSISIDMVCDVLVDEKRGVPVNRLAEVSNMLLKKNGEKCLDYKYSKMITEMRNTSFGNSSAGAGGRQWMYQTCTEFGFYQTSTAQPNLFSETLTVDFFVQQCGDIFGPRFLHTLESGVQRTNTLYGALDLVNHVTNVVFVHGSIDPWHALGAIKSDNPDAPAIYINGTAHCANLYPSSPKDLPQLTEARKQISSLIAKWLQQK